MLNIPLNVILLILFLFVILKTSNLIGQPVYLDNHFLKLLLFLLKKDINTSIRIKFL